MEYAVEQSRDREDEADDGARGADVKEGAGGADRRTRTKAPKVPMRDGNGMKKG